MEGEVERDGGREEKEKSQAYDFQGTIAIGWAGKHKGVGSSRTPVS